MNLKLLNKTELDARMKSLAARERELLHEILVTIKEIDRRSAYLDLGFASLFSYLVKGVGYSGGSAQRRIDGSRLLGEIPELGKKIQSGELKLHQISLVQKAAREVYKTSSQKVSSQEKRDLLECLSHKNHQDSQKEVAQFFDLPVIQDTKQKVQADESVRVELTLPKELYEKIQEAQGLLSHAVPTKDLVKYLEYVTDKVIQSKTRTRSTKQNPTATVASQGFSQKVKKQILQEQKCCQYIDPTTQKKCASRWFLQIDHRHSRWAGGTSEASNAQVLCSRHNRHKYLREMGIRPL